MPEELGIGVFEKSRFLGLPYILNKTINFLYELMITRPNAKISKIKDDIKPIEYTPQM